MKIDIRDYKILLEYDSQVTGILKSQLSFWKFIHSSENKLYWIPLEEEIFVKLKNYLTSDGIPYELSSAAEEYWNKIEAITNNFLKVKERAKRFKDGNFKDENFKQFREFITTTLKRKLKDHQLKAAFHLYIGENTANFSVPGSGKTTVVLSVYEKLRKEGKVNTLFVVGPPSCFGPWKNEFKETLGRIPDSVILAGGSKDWRRSNYYDTYNHKKELYLTSYHSLSSDQKDLDYFFKQKFVKAFFVVDEAHYIKQLSGSWAQAIMNQARKVSYRCVLTGTPMPKSYTDIFNLFDFLWPNENPISSSDKSIIHYNEQIGKSDVVKDVLDESIGPLFYRVRKKDLKLMPQNFAKPEIIEMGEIESKIYDAIFNRISDFSKHDYFKNIEFINRLGRGRMMRLRQAVSYPKLLNTAIDDYTENILNDETDIKSLILNYDKIETPAKVIYLLDKVKQFQNNHEKVVIWTNFIETIKLIEKHLKRNGIYCKKIYGSTPVEGRSLKDEETREKIRDEFVDPESGLNVLIANPAACAESISLHKTCHNAIYYDLSYNCAQYLQSLDRIHRVGGSEKIAANYYFLQYKNTIDGDIKRNLDRKKENMYAIIEEDYNIYSLNMFEPDGDAEAYKRIFIDKED